MKTHSTKTRVMYTFVVARDIFACKSQVLVTFSSRFASEQRVVIKGDLFTCFYVPSRPKLMGLLAIIFKSRVWNTRMVETGAKRKETITFTHDRVVRYCHGEAVRVEDVNETFSPLRQIGPKKKELSFLTG